MNTTQPKQPLKLTGSDTEPSIEYKRTKYSDCQHKRVYITEGECYLECQDCGKAIEPIWWLTKKAWEIEVNRQNARAIHENRIKTQNQLKQQEQHGRRSYKLLCELTHDQLSQAMCLAAEAIKELRSINRPSAEIYQQRLDSIRP